MIDFKSTLKIAVNSLKINKMRSILTSLGIIIGVSAVIIMLAVGSGAEKKIAKDLEAMGSNLLIVRSASITSGGVRMGSGTKPSLTLKDSDAIKHLCPSVLAVSPYSSETKQVSYLNQNWSTSIGGIGTEYFFIRDWEIESGRNFTDMDIENISKVAIVGNTVSLNLFGDLDPLNRTIRIENVPFKIIGTLKTKGQNGMGQDQDDIVYIPITTSQKKLFGTEFPGSVKSINIKAVDNDQLEDAKLQVEDLLRTRHRIGSGDDDFEVRNLTQMMETLKSTTKTMSLLLGAIASISLLVGGIGIMNIMMVSVTERTKEIGIRMAIGATAGDIRKQFLIESFLLSITGGLIGVIAGIVISQLITVFSSLSTSVSLFSIVISLGFSGFIGVTFGYYPAYKASLMNPIESLRYE